MGGVDVNDRMTALNKSRKTYHWYMRLVRKCFMLAAYNGYVLEGCFVNHSPVGKRKRDFNDFFLDLVHQLIRAYGCVNNKKRSSVSHGEAPARLDRKDHEPVVPDDATSNNLCVVCYEKYTRFVQANRNNRVPYAQIPVKKVKTVVKCTKCDVWLCVKRGSTCWQSYHSKVQFWR